MTTGRLALRPRGQARTHVTPTTVTRTETVGPLEAQHRRETAHRETEQVAARATVVSVCTDEAGLATVLEALGMEP